eukprot:CAMPEP_0118652348 /NCGR_PEP_ID=MMETSP0785-20121206/11269_1 /TAXON_ID=91992 /ORGANISM="Bolidomonas pacifica, Strain CCMP 1866" /LENGTH=200 /DNA_ID=CAMNT_0006544857 /DNA_START=122 /DNA_END=721 /DNA_ORIENTATION=+
MSYNGIGLASVRGTATSGHVQGNRSYVKPSRVRQATERNSEGMNKQKEQMGLLQARLGRNDDIVEHQKLRQVEMMLLDYRENLERRRVKDQDIEDLVEKERMRLRERMGLVKKEEPPPVPAAPKYVPERTGGDEDELDFEEDEDAEDESKKESQQPPQQQGSRRGTNGRGWARPQQPNYARSSRTNTHVLADLKQREMER